MSLLKVGGNGSSITWSSSHSDIISTEGVVKRPAYVDGKSTVSVKLTATIAKGAVQKQKEFIFSVKEKDFTVGEISGVAPNVTSKTFTVSTDAGYTVNDFSQSNIDLDIDTPGIQHEVIHTNASFNVTYVNGVFSINAGNWGSSTPGAGKTFKVLLKKDGKEQRFNLVIEDRRSSGDQSYFTLTKVE